MLMVTTEIAIFLGIIGAAMGSFAGAMAWRLKAKRNMVNDRSECEHCHHKLGALDLLPVVSWLLLGGTCRYCKKPIGWLPFVAEVGVATAFVLSYLYWPLGFVAWQATALFVMWLVYLVALAVLIIYDTRWMILPDRIVLPLIVAGFIDASLRTSLMPGAGIVEFILGAGCGMLALAGVYGVLYAVSKGRWVGFGDVKLSIFIGVILGWQKALLALILANVIGFLIVLPGLATRKLTRTSRVPFGPFLILAFVIAGLFGDAIIRWYIAFVGL